MEFEVHPFASVTCNTTVVELVTRIDCVVWFDGSHRFPIPDGAFNVTDPPWQKIVEPEAVMLDGGGGLTRTGVATDVPEQPPAVTMTV